MKKILSLQNPLVKHLVKLRKSRSYRLENQSALIEGKKLVKEVCCRVEATTILCADKSVDLSNLLAKEIFHVHSSVIKKISGAKSPEGILAEVPFPKESSLTKVTHLLALDGISDPGNLGTLLRTAQALGWDGVYLLENCCDPYNDKALRAAKGATFALPIKTGSWDELSKIAKSNQLLPVAADVVGEEFGKLKHAERVLLVLGHESSGLSVETLEKCKKVTIQMSGNVDSLNVAAAGAIMMYEFKSK